MSAYARVTDASLDTSAALALLRARYANDPFVVVVDQPPTMKDPLGDVYKRQPPGFCGGPLRPQRRTRQLWETRIDFVW